MQRTQSTIESTTRSGHSQLVSRDDLEARLRAVASGVADPVVGLYGPGSMVWEVNREAIVFLAGGRAALLQLAHPYVADAIAQHSNTRSDPFGRFRRTFRIVFAMVFGDLDDAFSAARRVHAVHRRIEGAISETMGGFEAGSRFRANEPHALLWVHATLWESSIYVYERVVRRLSDAEKERYYEETRRFAHLFGIDDAVLPTDWKAFEAYNHEMWRSTLSVGTNAREIGSFLFRPHLPGSRPLMWWLRLMTAGLMPEELREGFGLDFRPRHRRLFEISLAALRTTKGLWPRRLRYLPPYVAAQRRIAGDTRRDRVGEALHRLWLGEAP